MSAPILGHKQQIASLHDDLEADNVAHAYLFSGPAHVGKMTVAKWFADQLLTKGLPDEQKKTAGRHVENLTHPDLLVLDQLWIQGECEDWEVIAESSNVPQEHRSKKPTPAKTDTISIDDVRALQERLYGTGLAPHRCCIIRSVERMQEPAAHALLKTLEEPAGRLVFILTTQKKQLLLPTVTSRTRILQFRPLARGELQPLLDGLPDDDALFIREIAQGAPGIVKNLCSDPDLLRSERQASSTARAFWEEHRLKNRLDLLDPLGKRGEEGERLLLHLTLALRQQKPAVRTRHGGELLTLTRDLQTNVHRGLAVQRFALTTLKDD